MKITLRPSRATLHRAIPRTIACPRLLFTIPRPLRELHRKLLKNCAVEFKKKNGGQI